ncbi:MAG TPA: 16S rRNA (cytosine(967)-C(5))-methyltransferase RsmB [Burkholderiales bacterium]
MKGSFALAPALRDAARTVAEVAAGRSLADQLEGFGAGDTPRAILLDLTHGTLRRYGRMQAILRALSRRDQSDRLVEALLWCALYALESGRYAEYTVVDQAVRACGLLERWPAKGYVNALLRGFARQRQSLEARIRADAEARYQHPRWWIETLQRDRPEHWETVLQAGNSHPPMCLRVNRRRADTADYQARLDAGGIASRRVGDHALLLSNPVPVGRLPGFEAGDVSVQDAGAQRAAPCLDLAAGQRVLDACAAPGGKAAHIVESAEVNLIALDADPRRCERMRRNFERLGLSAQVRATDCTRLDDWWDGVAFERILADVPCSASGVVRRHPDVKWLRRSSDPAAFAARQAAILSALWRVLGAGGKLLYVTCSVFAQENEAVIDAFVAHTPGLQRLALPDGAQAQCLPDAEHDGFFYALLQKQA